MAGITQFIAGEEATVGDIHWSMEDDLLSFDIELTERHGGHDNEPTVAADYGSDIGVDPQIEMGNRVKFIDLDTHSGLWIVSGAELNFSKVQSAIQRVDFNRSLSSSKDSYHESDESWLQELATQTRLRVVGNNSTVDPLPIDHLKRFCKPILRWLGEEEARLRQLDGSSFERLLMTLIDRMGYHIKAVGDTNRKDGGIDIVAWPERGLPHVVAIQAKHHTVQTNTSVGDVRNFVGAIEANPTFNFGLMVTNTDFTADAKEFAKKVPSKVRLRTGRDIRRWLNHDFSGEADWLPDKIEIALGVTTELGAAPKLTDMNYEVNRARTVLDMFLPQGEYTREPFGKIFLPDKASAT